MENKIINITPLNPYISECDIKVLYHGKNRNRSYISKGVAEKMANSLPGTPIVGVFMDEKSDFDDHGERVVIENNKFSMKKITQSFGYVPDDTPVWWQQFTENGVTRDYMMCKGRLWTTRYPEAQRVIEKGNWQSMEIEPSSMTGEWMKVDYVNEDDKTFMVEDAKFIGLCILGEDVEPCFESAAIGAPGSLFSFVDDNSILSKMMEFNLDNEKALNEGGEQMPTIEGIKDAAGAVIDGQEPVVTEPIAEPTEPVVTEPVTEPAEPQEGEEEEGQEPEATEPTEPESPEEGEEQEPETTEEPELAEPEVPAEPEVDTVLEDLKNSYALAQEELETVKAEIARVTAELEAANTELTAFRAAKAQADSEAKDAMIAKFYMLSDEDIASVREAKDSLTVEQIEEKLSVIAVRNKVNFALDLNQEDSEDEPIVSFNAATVETIPAWMKAVENMRNRNK